MRNRPIVLSVLATLALLLAACGGGGDNNSSSTPSTSSDNTVCGKTTATGDLLAEVCDHGTITVSTDPAYPPQSSLDAKTGKYVGFDIDVATEIAHRLGVDIAWQTPSWDVLTAGAWNDRWQMSVGSMTPTNQRQRALLFSEPYYYTPAVVVVNEANTDITDLSTDLDGKKIGVCSGCTYEQFLDKTLKIRGYKFDFIIDNAQISGYDTDTTALQDLALGDGTRLDAVITSLTTAQGYIDHDNPVKIVGDPVFYEPLAVAIDKSSPKDPTSLAKAVNTIVKQMHADGTLSQLSKKWYNGTDLTKTQ
jgi:polar amino acid transport system substrate-binding protein